MANSFRFNVSEMIEIIQEKMQEEYMRKHYDAMTDKDLEDILEVEYTDAQYKLSKLGRTGIMNAETGYNTNHTGTLDLSQIKEERSKLTKHGKKTIE